MSNTITRRTTLAGAAALPLLPAAALAVPVTLPLLPVSAFATPAVEASSDEDRGFQELLVDLKKLPPKLREAIIRMVNALADEQRARKAGVLS